MTQPTVSWDETSPAGSQAISLGDDRIRELKTQLREVIAADHIMASSGQSATTGYHNKVTLVEQGSSPSMVDNTFMFFAKEADSKSELYMDTYNATRAEQQLTENGNWIGGIQYEVRMFSGLTANIPTGWVLCDGSNSTPDLTDKFIRATDTSITSRVWTGGAGEFNTGGADTATLTSTELPAHTHTATVGTQSANHSHAGTVTTNASGGGSAAVMYTATTSYGATFALSIGNNNANHNHVVTNSSTGSGTAFSILPSYVELMFLMKS